MKKLIAMLSAAFTLMSLPAAAQEKLEKSTNESAVVSPLRKGQAAPFSGVLFSQKAAATVITDIRLFDEKVKIEVDKAVKTTEARKQFELDEIKSQCKSDKAVLSADAEEKKKKIEFLGSELKKSSDSMPNKNLWFTAGVVGGIVFTVATAFVVGQLSN